MFGTRFRLLVAVGSIALVTACGREPQLGRQSPAESAARAAKPVSERAPAHLVGVGIDEHLGKALPRDLTFVNERGRRTRLGKVFAANLPVIITLNYSNCPMLCSLELDGLVKGLKQLSLELGRDYRIVTVSLDPKETPEVAHKTQQRYLKQYGRPGASDYWQFLTGSERNIRALAAAVGFRYRYNEDENQYYHAAAIALASPSGRLARYLYGIQYDPQTLELALVEASQGTIGTPINHLLLFCSAYDPKKGGYGLVASRLISLGGLLTFGVLGGFVMILWGRDRRKNRKSTSAEPH